MKQIFLLIIINFIFFSFSWGQEQDEEIKINAKSKLYPGGQDEAPLEVKEPLIPPQRKIFEDKNIEQISDEESL